MNKNKTLKKVGCMACCVVFLLSLTMNFGIYFAHPAVASAAKPVATTPTMDVTQMNDDEQLAYLLVKLMKGTRREIGGHFTRNQSPIPVVDRLYQHLMVKNLILPAAVADHVFAEAVPNATDGRAWVKMVVDQPRNPHNRADEVAMTLLADLRNGAASKLHSTSDAFYYAEPIKAKKACLYCHGGPKGDPDPYFPQYEKNGWQEGDIIGAVVARVAPRNHTSG